MTLEDTIEFQLLTDSEEDDGKVEFIVETTDNLSNVQHLQTLLQKAIQEVESLRFEITELKKVINSPCVSSVNKT